MDYVVKKGVRVHNFCDTHISEQALVDSSMFRISDVGKKSSK